MKRFFQFYRFIILFAFAICYVEAYAGGYGYSKVYVSKVQDAGGRVYVNNSNSKPLNPNSSSENKGGTRDDDGKHTYYFWADTNPGYTFLGWYDAEEGGTRTGDASYSERFDAAEKKKNMLSYNRYARWKANNYTVTYNPQSGTVTPASKSVTFASTYGDLPTPTRANHDFAGWWTASTGGSQVTSSTTVTTPSHHNIYAHWKTGQTITWTQDIGDKIRSNQFDLNATASSGLTVTYTASPSGRVLIEGNHVTCLTAGEVTITANQAGNENASLALSYYASSNTPTKTFTIEEHTITAAPTASKSVTYETPLSEIGLVGGTTNVDAIDGGTWHWDNGSTRPTAGTHSYLAYFAPDNTSGAFTAIDTLQCYVSVTVNKATPDITCTIGNEYDVDEEINLAADWTSEGDGARTYSIVSFAQLNDKNGGAAGDPVITENRLYLRKAGTLVIQMAVAEGTNYNARTGLTKTITINKRENTITNNKGSWEFVLGFNDELESITFGSTNTTGPAITVNTDDKVTTYNAGEHKFSSNFRRGDGVWTIAQEEDYKYEGANATLTFHVDVESCNCYVAKDATEYSMYWGNSTKDRYLTWSEIGVAGTVYYKAKRGGADSGARLSLYPKYGTADWETTALTTIHDSFKSSYSDSPLSYSLSDSTATGINFRLEGASTVNAHVKEMYVSRRRWIKLQDAERNTITNIAMPINVMGGTQTATFYVNFSTCNEEIKLASTHPHITLSHDTLRIIPNTNADGGSGRRAITITYTNATPESISGDIMVYTANEHAQIHVTAETEKHTQTISWGSAYSATTPTISVNKSITDAATASSSMQVLYRSSDESIIEIINEGQGFRAIAEGTATITAYQSGNDEYAEVESSKTFITSAKQIRHISWTQDFMRLTTESDPRPLTARVYIENPETGALTYNEAQSGLVTYTSSDVSVVRINPETKYLSVVGAGTAVLTASIEDDGSYSAASTTTPVRVRVPSEGCDDDPLPATPQGSDFMDGDEIVFYAFNTNPGVFYKIVAIDVTNGVPESVSFKIKGTNWGGTVYRGNLHLQQSEDMSNWEETAWEGEQPPTDNYKLIENISLNHNTRYLRFWRDGNAWGYHQIANITVNPAQYIESTLPKDGSGRDLLAFGDVRVGTTKDVTVRINYTNAKSDLQVAIANTTDFSIVSGSEIEIAECGSKGYADVIIRCNPTNAGPLSTTMTVTDVIANKILTINVTASISRAPQVIVWEPARAEFYTVETAAFQAALPTVTDKGVDVSLASSATGVVSFTGQTATIHTNGDVTITASQAGTPNYEAAESVSKDFTINLTPTVVVTAPTIDDAVVGTELASLELDASAAVVNNTITNAAVAGTFSVQSGEIGSVGIHTVTLLFTPTESEKYTTCTCEVDVEILPKEITFHNAAGDSKWETEGNWSESGVDENSAVTVTGNLVIDEEVPVYSLTISEGGIVTIAPNGGLTVGAGGISGASKDKLILKAQAVDDDVKGIKKGQTGYLRISPNYTGDMPEAQVEMLIKAYKNTSTGVTEWQYVGSPVQSIAASSVFHYLYNWYEDAGKWKNKRSTTTMAPFNGYAATQNTDPDGDVVIFKGDLVSMETQTVALTYTESSANPGCNVVANSFAAPIDISRMTAEDFPAGAEATINFFNAGSKADLTARELTKVVDVDAAGQYIPVPVVTASTLHSEFGYPIVIPSMQGFYVMTTAAGNMTLDYERLVWNGDYSETANTPLRVRNKNKANSEDDELSGTLKITLTAQNSVDHLFMIESQDYDASYENGYDARKIMSDELNIYAVEGEDELAIDATNSIIGTRVGVRTGEETAYTLLFSSVKGEEVALFDNETEQTIDINDGMMYTFFAEPNSNITERFMIVEREGAPAVTTGNDKVTSDVRAHKFIKDSQLFILKNGVLYDATGARVK